MTHILHQMFVYYMENPSELSEKFRPADDSVEARAQRCATTWQDDRPLRAV